MFRWHRLDLSLDMALCFEMHMPMAPTYLMFPITFNESCILAESITTLTVKPYVFSCRYIQVKRWQMGGWNDSTSVPTK